MAAPTAGCGGDTGRGEARVPLVYQAYQIEQPALELRVRFWSPLQPAAGFGDSFIQAGDYGFRPSRHS